jgi:hypothetical protein
MLQVLVLHRTYVSYVEPQTTVGIKAGMGDPLTVRTSTATTILMLPYYPTLVAVEEPCSEHDRYKESAEYDQSLGPHL